jgi:hypothetical protein
MSYKGLIVISSGTKKVFAITISVALLAVVFAIIYYRGVNRSEDPRVAGARLFMSEYDRTSGVTETFSSFSLLDSAALIYRRVPGYRSSWETGVIYNNKCSALLLKALYDSTIAEPEKNTLLELSIVYCDSSISLYKTWLDEWGDLPEEIVAQRLLPGMSEDDPAFTGLVFKRLFRKRVSDLMLAQIETPRRLSVSYTNKATAYRHLMMQDSALSYYDMALSLWKDNRTAESNLNVLLGGEPIKPGLIKSLFPPDRKKRQNE